jgi:hypothetical protein
MKRRNFIKNTGLTLAGIALTNAIYSKNKSASKSLHLVILMSGGVRFNDIIKTENNGSSLLFQEKGNIQIKCKTKVKYAGTELEHVPSLWAILSQFKNQKGRKILISRPNTEINKLLLDSNLGIEILPSETPSINSYSNDTAIFELANQCLNGNDDSTIILNLEDTDVAHYNAKSYFEVLNFYKQKIEGLCNKVFTKQFLENFNIKLTVASTIGRNNFNNEITEGGTDHYHQSARDLFCYEVNYAQHYSFEFDHQNYDSRELLTFNDISLI